MKARNRDVWTEGSKFYFGRPFQKHRFETASEKHFQDYGTLNILMSVSPGSELQTAKNIRISSSTHFNCIIHFSLLQESRWFIKTERQSFSYKN